TTSSWSADTARCRRGTNYKRHRNYRAARQNPPADYHPENLSGFATGDGHVVDVVIEYPSHLKTDHASIGRPAHVGVSEVWRKPANGARICTVAVSNRQLDLALRRSQVSQRSAVKAQIPAGNAADDGPSGATQGWNFPYL